MKYLLIILSLALAFPAYAQNVAPLETPARQVELIEAATGNILFSKDANSHMATSSMGKLMTMYVVFEAIKNGKLKLDDMLPVSEYAWKQEGSRMFLKVGDKASVQDLIRGVIVQSGNDASVVFAEYLGGSEANFATIMNAKAHELGMNDSHFMNATGLPDPQHYSTAHDMAILARAIMRDFPEDYRYFSETEFKYNNIKQGNRNPLLYRNIGVDGLKTGHAEEAGYGLTASSLRDGRRLILVINGLSDMQARADESAKVLDWGYREFGLYSLLKKDQKVGDAKTWLGLAASVPVLCADDLTISLARPARNEMKVTINYDQPIQAPIAKGQPIGKAIVTAPGIQPVEVPLVAGADVQPIGFFARMVAKLNLFFGKA